MSEILFTFIAVIVAVLVVFWVVKSLAKAAIAGVVAAIIVFVIYSFAIYTDFADIKKNFSTNDKVFLLSEDDTLLSGIIITKLKFSGTPTHIKQEELKKMEKNFSNKDYEGMLRGNERLFIVDIQALESGLPRFVNLSSKIDNISREKLIDIIRADDPIIEYGGASAAELGIDANGPEEARAYFFGAAFTQAIENRGAGFILEEYLKGRIVTSPETAVFKNLKRMPGFIKNRLIKALSDEA